MTVTSPRSRRWRRALLITLASLLALLLVAIAASQLSPWPSVLLLRAVGDDGSETAAQSEALVSEGVQEHLDIPYSADDPDLTMDVFRPEGDQGPLPAVVWVHGGGFIGGSKEMLRPYLAILASHGFVTVNVEYQHAPEEQYPAPVEQLSAALEHVTAEAEQLGTDPAQIVLGGDSAGAHIAGQTALAISDAEYASRAGLPQALPAASLRAALLFSGPSDLSLAETDDRLASWYIRTVIWAYTGQKDVADSPELSPLSLVDHVSAAYPPSFISTGPSDPLLSHSESMSAHLEAAGAETTTLFFDPETTPESVGHEYALALDTPQAAQAMVETVAFLHAHTDGPQLPGASAQW